VLSDCPKAATGTAHAKDSALLRSPRLARNSNCDNTLRRARILASSLQWRSSSLSIWAANWSGGTMKVVYPFLVVVFAGALSAASQSASAQRGRNDDARRREAIENSRRRNDDRWNDDRRWNDNDPWNDRRDARPGVRRGQDEEWYRRQRARREEWCRRHRNDRRCDDFFRRSNQASWCWDRNRDGRCDNFDNRRDTRGIFRRYDNGPEWQRWLQSFGFDVREEAPLVVPR
jgi:hypothetical protein